MKKELELLLEENRLLKKKSRADSVFIYFILITIAIQFFI